MGGGVASTLRDTDPLFTGTHKGATGLTLYDAADFKSCGAAVGLAVQNVTDESFGEITAVAEGSVTTTLTGGTLNTWTSGDTYEIYRTDTYNSVISTHYEDRRYGHKVFNQDALVNGIKADEQDIDEHSRNVFGPGQPSKSKKGF
jgi:hypothetical protein